MHAVDAYVVVSNLKGRDGFRGCPAPGIQPQHQKFATFDEKMKKDAPPEAKPAVQLL